MALFRYIIIFSPPAFGQCDEGNTTILSIEINEQLQPNVDKLRQSDNSCVFINTSGLEVGPAGTSVDVTINAQIDTAADGNRNFSFFMCSGGWQYIGPSISPDSDSDGAITLKAKYTVGSKVKGGDCVGFLKSKINNKESDNKFKLISNISFFESKNSKARRSTKERTKVIIKKILGK